MPPETVTACVVTLDTDTELVEGLVVVATVELLFEGVV